MCARRVEPTGLDNAVDYHQDGLGSTAALTSAAGALLESYRYDAFGKQTVYDGSGSVIPETAHGNRFMFAGREYIAELKLYDYRNRFYSPELGRFLQTDPLRFGAGDANIYRYVGNNSQNARDPLGLLCDEDNPLGFGRPPGFVDDLTKSLLDESGSGNDGGGTSGEYTALGPDGGYTTNADGSASFEYHLGAGDNSESSNFEYASNALTSAELVDTTVDLTLGGGSIGAMGHFTGADGEAINTSRH